MTTAILYALLGTGAVTSLLLLSTIRFVGCAAAPMR